MAPTREAQKKEALKRMERFGISLNAVRDFSGGIVSESFPPYGRSFLVADKAQLRRIKDFEEKENAVVYHAIRSPRCENGISEMECYLFVCKYEDEWSQDFADILDKKQIAYVFNRKDPQCSEMGYIGVEQAVGGLRRSW